VRQLLTEILLLAIAAGASAWASRSRGCDDRWGAV
jgi:hypothetical protein